MNVKKASYSYPLPDKTATPPRAGWLHRMLARAETAKILRRRQKQDGQVEISLFSPAAFRPLEAEDVPLVFLAHNDGKMVPALLAHYRLLGVTRFICVDDQSEDGCREWLAAQSDVDVWVSPVRYRDAKRGKLWREALFARYGKDRWYVNIDADEFLVYQDCFNRPLPKLIERLESLGEFRFAAPMIDLYPTGGVSGAGFDGRDGRMPWDVAGHFDANGYVVTIMKRFLSLSGGPRVRKLNAEVELMKYPLLYWDDRCSFGVSIHQPTPFEWNFHPISGALLHFKFFADLQEKLVQAIEDRQYFDDAREYKRIFDVLEQDRDLDFGAEISTPYAGPDQLVEMGFMRRLWR